MFIVLKSNFLPSVVLYFSELLFREVIHKGLWGDSEKQIFLYNQWVNLSWVQRGISSAEVQMPTSAFLKHHEIFLSLSTAYWKDIKKKNPKQKTFQSIVWLPLYLNSSLIRQHYLVKLGSTKHKVASIWDDFYY